jgi:hypothetical protein
LVGRIFVDADIGRKTTGRLITTSGNWSTITNWSSGYVHLVDQFVNSRLVDTTSNKSTSCLWCQLVECKRNGRPQYSRPVVTWCQLVDHRNRLSRSAFRSALALLGAKLLALKLSHSLPGARPTARSHLWWLPAGRPGFCRRTLTASSLTHSKHNSISQGSDNVR